MCLFIKIIMPTRIYKIFNHDYVCVFCFYILIIDYWYLLQDEKSNAFTHYGFASLYVGTSLPQYMIPDMSDLDLFEEPHFECADLSEMMFQDYPQRDL